MFRPMGKFVLTLAVAGGLLLLSPLFKASTIGGVAWAQAQDEFNATYFDASVGGGTVSIINPTANPVVCAMIYVFKDDEEMDECCGCPVTTEGLRTIAVQSQPPAIRGTPIFGTLSNDLTSNPLHGILNPRGVIKILSSLPNAGPFGCNPALAPVLPISNSLREYSTNLQASEMNEGPYVCNTTGCTPSGADDTENISVTEKEFLGAPDPTTSGEVAFLLDRCSFIHTNGSGLGICGCGIGDLAPHGPRAK